MTFIPLGANQPSNGWKISIWAIEFIQQHTIEIQRGLSWETYSLSIGAFIALQYDGIQDQIKWASKMVQI